MNTLNEAFVWEVSTYEFTYNDADYPNDGYVIGDTIDNGYIVTTDEDYSDEFYEALITESGFVVENCVVQVYSARTATLIVNRNNKVDVYEADCSTGYSGSAIYERCAD